MTSFAQLWILLIIFTIAPNGASTYFAGGNSLILVLDFNIKSKLHTDVLERR